MGGKKLSVLSELFSGSELSRWTPLPERVVPRRRSHVVSADDSRSLYTAAPVLVFLPPRYTRYMEYVSPTPSVGAAAAATAAAAAAVVDERSDSERVDDRPLAVAAELLWVGVAASCEEHRWNSTGMLALELSHGCFHASSGVNRFVLSHLKQKQKQREIKFHPTEYF